MPDSPPRPWIRPRDQTSLLALVTSLLVMMASYWLYHGGHEGKLIDIDRADPLEARFLVDINRADWPEMIQLPGLGETMARRIISDRQQRGPFHSVEQLDRVNGIGPRTMERLRPYLMPIPVDTDWATSDLQLNDNESPAIRN
ncbi:ComEA family DNA-binding protein [Bythopirellula polymerisocia]|uniref:ComEA family DNA-binding protein n=1 Tax=Bythopirellula polymerisocia TaxID=2528003 RepID=UPI0018D2BE95|nr:helix-hairpin-helix domain-containing protein [Bythopirellula polymerisocia]